tara:strand:- start:61 stop:645 length:585 start_codon:yes stop_codon:yes gene_type:complete
MEANSNSKSDPCKDMLTDIDYLKHMIPHHQVAVDMSVLLIPHTQNPTMLHLCRNIIRKQKYEIWEMNNILKNISDTIFVDDTIMYSNDQTKLDKYEPINSKSKDGECDPLFFKPDDHSKHMEHMEISEKSYLEHMIPHHQVAVDMSRRLLLHTNHSYLLDFCKKLIIDQQTEILYMNNLLNNKYNHYSPLLDSK